MTQRYKSNVWIRTASIALSLALTGGVDLAVGAEPAGAGGALPGDTMLGRFELFSPAFSGIGSNALADVARRFPGGTFGAHDPEVIHAANPEAKAYRYQLGPFVQIRCVPKQLSLCRSAQVIGGKGLADSRLFRSPSERMQPVAQLHETG